MELQVEEVMEFMTRVGKEQLKYKKQQQTGFCPSKRQGTGPVFFEGSPIKCKLMNDCKT